METREPDEIQFKAVEEIQVEITEDELGFNRTGIMTNPELSAELIQGAKETPPSSDGSAEDVAAIRTDYLAEALPIGSPPITLENGPEDIDESSPELFDALPVLLDKLGERLAFERQGTRVYEAFLQKFEALEVGNDMAPTLEDIQRICKEELEHFKMLQKAIVELGGDATVQTPCADVVGVISQGALKVVVDPSTTLGQTLQALLTVELTDNDGWEMLEQLSAKAGLADLEKQCRRAFEEEQEHLTKVRQWLLSATLEEAFGAESTIMAAPEPNASKQKSERPAKRQTKSSGKSGSSKKSSRKK